MLNFRGVYLPTHSFWKWRGILWVGVWGWEVGSVGSSGGGGLTGIAYRLRCAWIAALRFSLARGMPILSDSW